MSCENQELLNRPGKGLSMLAGSMIHGALALQRLDYYDLDGDATKIGEFDLDGWVFAASDSEDDEDAAPAEAVSVIAKSREEFKELTQGGLTYKPDGGTIGVHLGNSIWRAGRATGPVYGRSWGTASGRTPMQALIRVLILMWTDHVAKATDDNLAAKVLSRLSKLWEANPGKP